MEGGFLSSGTRGKYAQGSFWCSVFCCAYAYTSVRSSSKVCAPVIATRGHAALSKGSCEVHCCWRTSGQQLCATLLQPTVRTQGFEAWAQTMQLPHSGVGGTFRQGDWAKSNPDYLPVSCVEWIRKGLSTSCFDLLLPCQTTG